MLLKDQAALRQHGAQAADTIHNQIKRMTAKLNNYKKYVGKRRERDLELGIVAALEQQTWAMAHKLSRMRAGTRIGYYCCSSQVQPIIEEWLFCLDKSSDEDELPAIELQSVFFIAQDAPSLRSQEFHPEGAQPPSPRTTRITR